MRELTTWAKLLLFIISYSPLAMVYVISDFSKCAKYWFKTPILSWCAVCLCLLAIPVLLGFVRFYRKKGAARNEVESVKVAKVRPLDQEVLSYIVTYMLPFLQLPENNKEITVVFMFVMVFFLYVNSNMIGINPVLNLLGFSIFEVEDDKSYRRIVIAPTRERHGLLRAKNIMVVDICGELEFLVEVGNGEA